MRCVDRLVQTVQENMKSFLKSMYSYYETVILVSCNLTQQKVKRSDPVRPNKSRAHQRYILLTYLVASDTKRACRRALSPQAARAGTRTTLTLSPTPPVLCLPTTTPDQSEGKRSRPPDWTIASVSAAVSESLIPRRQTAISIAPASVAIPSHGGCPLCCILCASVCLFVTIRASNSTPESRRM